MAENETLYNEIETIQQIKSKKARLKLAMMYIEQYSVRLCKIELGIKKGSLTKCSLYIMKLQNLILKECGVING